MTVSRAEFAALVATLLEGLDAMTVGEYQLAAFGKPDDEQRIQDGASDAVRDRAATVRWRRVGPASLTLRPCTTPRVAAK